MNSTALPKLARELRRLRAATELTVDQVDRRSRGRVGCGNLVLAEQGVLPSPHFLRAAATFYRVAPWRLLKLAGYVTDQDAVAGVEAIKARRAA